MNISEINTPFKFDITQEFNELKLAYTCKVCGNLYKNPKILNTCNHIFCDACLDKRKVTCPTCKNPYNEIDVKADNFTDTVLRSIWRIENLSKQVPIPENNTNYTNGNDINYEICISDCSMKRNPKGETQLHRACKKGNLISIEPLIKSGVNINVTDWARWAPIHEAIEGKHYNCVELLLKNGALINLAGANYVTPLHKAISCELDDIVELLLKFNADKTLIDYLGQTPFDYVYDKDKLHKYESIKPETILVPRVFVSKDIVLYLDDNIEEKRANFQKKGVKFVNKQDFYKKDEVTHSVISDNSIKSRLLDLNLLFGIVKGIFIVNEEWLNDIPLKIIPYKYIVGTYRNVIKKSIENRLNSNPRLFDGINFHIEYDEPVKINGLTLTRTNLSLLIDSGGGKILNRPPALRTVSEDHCYPFHARESEHLNRCCNYIVYNEDKPPKLSYNMRELQHKSSKWLVDCILNFRIVD